MGQGAQSVVEIVKDIGALGSGAREVSVGRVVESFGGRSYGPSLLVPALLGMSPVGAIPGVPAFLAVLIALFALQILIGRSHFWLPGIIARRSLPGEKLAAARAKLERPAKWLDRAFHGRLEWAVRAPFLQIAAVVILALCVLIVPLEVVPFAAAIPFAAIAAFGLAIMVRDGVLMLLAIAASAASFGFALSALGG